MERVLVMLSRGLFCIAIAALSITPGHASPPPAESRSTMALAIDRYVQDLTRRSAFSGNVLVVRNGKPIFSGSFGYADVEFGVRNSAQTRFRIFSITKQFTAAAIMLLAQRRALGVDESIRSYLPSLPSTWHPITVRELLNHTSGLPQLEDAWGNGFLSDPSVRTQLQNLRAVLPQIAKAKPITLPGTKWLYNNFGYDLLGAIVEAVSGQRYDLFVKNNILASSKMSNSGFVGEAAVPEPPYDGPAIVSRLAHGYNGNAAIPSDLQQAMPLQYASAPAGDMYSTISDMLSYSNALDAATVLTNSTQASMVDGAFPINENGGYGFGWIVSTVHGHRIVHHSGSNNGYAAEFARFPEDHVVMVILSNYGFANVEQMRRDITVMLFGQKYAP